MSATLLPAAKWRFTKDDGTPAANYVVHTYTTGGPVTGKNTYTTSDKSVSNGSQVTLNARGEADIWWDGLYYIEVYKSAADGGALVWAVDNYGNPTGASADFLTDIANGSFEDGTDASGYPIDWTAMVYTGATLSVDSTQSMHGKYSAKVVGVGNGGTVLVSNDYIACAPGEKLAYKFALLTTSATIRNVFEFLWYDSGKNLLSTTSAYDNQLTSPTSKETETGTVTAPASAVYYRIRATLIHPSGTTTTGSSWIDGIEVGNVGRLDAANDWSNTNTVTTQSVGDSSTKVASTAFVQTAVAHAPGLAGLRYFNYLNFK